MKAIFWETFLPFSWITCYLISSTISSFLLLPFPETLSHLLYSNCSLERMNKFLSSTLSFACKTSIYMWTRNCPNSVLIITFPLYTQSKFLLICFLLFFFLMLLAKHHWNNEKYLWMYAMGNVLTWYWALWFYRFTVCTFYSFCVQLWTAYAVCMHSIFIMYNAGEWTQK